MCLTFVCSFLLIYSAGQTESVAPLQFPSWITSNPGFANPKVIDSIAKGNGSVSSEDKEDAGWVIHLNDKRGYGIEIHLDNLSLSTESNDFLLICAYEYNFPKPEVRSGVVSEPVELQKVKLFTGGFDKGRWLRLPDTMSMFVLYSAAGSSVSPQFHLNYRRYGTSYEKNQQPTENPLKKETLCEIQLKGRAPNDYSDSKFVTEFKEAVRATAKDYCLKNNISFNENITTDDMVLLHRISLCPFEWPERDVCVSILHSVYVSGTKLPGGLIADFQLIAEHLRSMWMEPRHPEMEKLGITVYKLPEASAIVMWWSVLIGIVIVSSLLIILVFCSIQKYSVLVRFRSETEVSAVSQHKKKPKLHLAKHQVVPPFMYMDCETSEDPALKAATKEALLEDARPGAPLRPPIANYAGALYFSSNKAFEDDENVEFRRK